MHRVFYDTKIIGIVFGVLISAALYTNGVASEKDILWSFKSKSKSSETHVNWTFKKVQLIHEELRFSVVAHNSTKDTYKCVFITAGENTIHMDDGFGNEYVGMKVNFANNLDNKLAPNQRKRINLIVPRYQNDVALVNLHFGLYSSKVKSGAKCKEPVGQHGYNFHQLDWEVSGLE